MSKKLTQYIEDQLAPAVNGLGYELCDVEFKSEEKNMVLTLFIHKEEGISLEDCEVVSRAIDPILDELDPIEEPYYLSVSSLGLDRSFKRDRDFERFLGKPVEIKLYAPINSKKEFTGKLITYLDKITIDTGKGVLEFDKKTVAVARPHIEF